MLMWQRSAAPHDRQRHLGRLKAGYHFDKQTSWRPVYAIRWSYCTNARTCTWVFLRVAASHRTFRPDVNKCSVSLGGISLDLSASGFSSLEHMQARSRVTLEYADHISVFNIRDQDQTSNVSWYRAVSRAWCQICDVCPVMKSPVWILHTGAIFTKNHVVTDHITQSFAIIITAKHDQTDSNFETTIHGTWDALSYLIGIPNVATAAGKHTKSPVKAWTWWSIYMSKHQYTFNTNSFKQSSRCSLQHPSLHPSLYTSTDMSTSHTREVKWLISITHTTCVSCKLKR